MTLPRQSLSQSELVAAQARLADLWLPKLRETRIQILATLAGTRPVKSASYFLVEGEVVPAPSGRSGSRALEKLHGIGIPLLVIDRLGAEQLARETRPWDLQTLEQALPPGPQALRRSVESGLLEGKIFEPFAALKKHEIGAFVDEWRRRQGMGIAIPPALLRAVKMATRRHLTEYLPPPIPKG